MFVKRLAVSVLVVLASLYVVGCGGGAAATTVAITASATSVDGSDAINITATVSGGDTAGVTWSLTGVGALSAQTTTSVTYTAPAVTTSAQTATITATSISHPTAAVSATFTIPAKTALSFTSININGTEGAAYSVNLNAAVSGGITPYKWTATGLPACLTLSSSGTLTTTSGTAPNFTCTGTFAGIAFTVTDSGVPTPLPAITASGLSITINPAASLALASTLAASTATAGIAYTGSVAAGTPGGVAPLTYAVTGGALPTGITLTGTTGALSGTATVAGTYHFTVGLTDTFGDPAASQAYALTVVPGAVTHFLSSTSSPTTVTAGTVVLISVTALDASGNIATNYTGTVKITSTDAAAGLPANPTLTNGVGGFAVTLNTAGSQTITATDTGNSALTTNIGPFTVSAGTLSKLVMTAPTTAVAGTAFNVTVKAEDVNNNVITSDTEVVQITSSDGAAGLPTATALVNGVQTFSVVLNTATTETVTAKGLTSSLTAGSGNITVNPGAAASLQVSVTSPVVAGNSTSLSVTAMDASNNVATGYTGTVHFTTTDAGTGKAVPADYTFVSGDQGRHTFGSGVTLVTVGSQTVTATDTVTGSITGTSGSVTVVAAATSHFLVNISTSQIAGVAFNARITAKDAFNNTATGYAGTIHFSTTDLNGSVSIPGNYTFVPGTDAGTHLFTSGVKLVTAGSQTVTATDGPNSIVGSATTTVSAAAESNLTISPATTTPTAGTAFNVTVTVVDQYGNTVTGSTDGITLSTSAASSTLPLNSALSNGTKTIAVTLNSAGGSTITATDITSGSITAATTGTITVSAAAASLLNVVALTPQTAGAPFNMTVTAKDPFGNTVTNYAGTVHFTKTDAGAGSAVPANYTFVGGDNGTHVFNSGLTLVTAGAQVVTATDTSTAITGLANINVTVAAVSKLVVVAPANATSNVPINVTVTAEDQYNNVVTGFPDTVTFSTTDGAGVMPGNSGLTNGVKQFSATLKTNGNQTITATDTGNGAIHGTSGTINVSTALIVTSPATLPPGNMGSTYSYTLGASGGTGAGYTWSLTNSNLTAYGLTLNAGTGAITSATSVLQSGSAAFTANVLDNGSNTANQAETIQMYSALSLPAANSLPAGYTGVAYTGSIPGSGGNSPSIAITTVLSPSNGSLAANVVGTSVNLTGTPTAATTESIKVTLTDTTTGNSINQTYTFSIGTPPTPTLSSVSPGTASQNVAYTGSISQSGGLGPNYTWSINSTPLAAGASYNTNLDGLSVSYTSGNSGTLNITGTPTSVSNNPGVQFTAVVTDTISGKSSTSTQYTIVVNPNGSTVSGNISLNNNCNNSVPTGFFTVTLTNTGTSTIFQTQTTDSNGNYTFTGVPDGTYSITPSVVGASSTLFSPVSYTGLALSASGNNNVTGKNFNGNVNFDVSGHVSYSGSQTGWTYLYMNNNNCGGGSGGPGTAISATTLGSGGAFTIRGVPPGSYTLSAWMDPLAQGVQNNIDPTGSTSLTVTSLNVTGKAITIADPAFTTPTTNPTIQGVIPNAQGLLMEFKPSTINNPGASNNGEEDANQYVVEWSTSSQLGGGSGGAQFNTVIGSHTFPAGGKNGVWILTNQVFQAGLSNGTSTGAGFTGSGPYYFQARSVNTLDTANPHPSGWCNYTSNGCTDTTPADFTPVTIGTPSCTSNCTAVTSSITIPGGTGGITIKPGATLYEGLVELNAPGGSPVGIYVTEVAATQGTTVYPFTITVPNGSLYAVIGILDQNNTGGFGGGTISNTNDNLQANLTINTGTTQTVAGITLPASNSLAYLGTQFNQSTCQGCGSTSTSYLLNFGVIAADKLPVAVTLNSGAHLPNNSGTVALDMANCTGCGGSAFKYSVSLPGGTPAVGNSYSFTVTYSDGTQDTGTTVNTPVVGWDGGSTLVGASDAVTFASMLPNGNTGPSAGTRTTPTFTWTPPANSILTSDFSYSFYISQQNGTCPNNNCQIWQIPGQNSKSNGFTSSTTSLTWGTDPTDNSNTPNGGNLISNDLYDWQIQIQDPYNNSAQTDVWYQP